MSVAPVGSTAMSKELGRGTPPSPTGSETAGDRSRRMPVASYVRMSTEHQKYSTENQTAEIERYAEAHGMDVVRTYIDAGKSGLQVVGRTGMQQLIDDVTAGRADFEAILVYDVSRWGRFQNPDEAAYFEHQCTREGIHLEYCAEQFDNDGTPVSTIIKGVKRVMAAEYSRELSTKVFAGQCRLIQLGYRQGGMAGYGLRRMRIDQTGKHLGMLGYGEYKNLQTDRVILVLGPQEEVETVRWMFREFVENGRRESEIADELNRRGLKTHTDSVWTRDVVHRILTNEKYIGNNLYNRRSFKLKERRVANAPKDWVRAEGAFERIVEPEMFLRAQELIRARRQRMSDEEMLERLRQLYARNGYLSGIIIDEAEDLPSSGVYQRRFGSLNRAYVLVGFTPGRDYRYIAINRGLRRLHAAIVSEIVRAIEVLGGSVTPNDATGLFTINGEVTASVVIARFRRTAAGAKRWIIRLDTGLAPDVTVAARMDDSNEKILDYYLLPFADITTGRIRLTEENGFLLDSFRFETLEYFFSMAKRYSFTEIAAWPT